MAGPVPETQRLSLIAVFLQETMRRVHKTAAPLVHNHQNLIEFYKCSRHKASQYAIEQHSFYLLKGNC